MSVLFHHIPEFVEATHDCLTHSFNLMNTAKTIHVARQALEHKLEKGADGVHLFVPFKRATLYGITLPTIISKLIPQFLSDSSGALSLFFIEQNSGYRSLVAQFDKADIEARAQNTYWDGVALYLTKATSDMAHIDDTGRFSIVRR